MEAKNFRCSRCNGYKFAVKESEKYIILYCLGCEKKVEVLKK